MDTDDAGAIRAIRGIRGLKKGRLGWRRGLSCFSCLSWFLLAGCSAKGVTTVSVVTTLDCSPGYEAVKAKIVGRPGLTAAPKEAGEPYDWYSSADGATSYVITEPGAPGHPAIVMQRAADGQQATAGCSYGDKAGYQKLLAYLQSLNGAAHPKGAGR